VWGIVQLNLTYNTAQRDNFPSSRSNLFTQKGNTFTSVSSIEYLPFVRNRNEDS